MNQRLPRDWRDRLSRLVGEDRARQWLGILAQKRQAKFKASQAPLTRIAGQANALDALGPVEDPTNS